MKNSSHTKQSNRPVRWMQIPYFPISVKYLVLMAVVFIVGVMGTGMSKFESFAVSFVAYSTGLLLERVEILTKMLKGIVVSEN